MLYYYYAVYIIDHKYIIINQKKYIHFIEMYRRLTQAFKKNREIQKWAGTVVKSSKRSGIVQKVYY